LTFEAESSASAARARLGQNAAKISRIGANRPVYCPPDWIARSSDRALSISITRSDVLETSSVEVRRAGQARFSCVPPPRGTLVRSPV